MPTSTRHFPISTVNAYVAGAPDPAGTAAVHPLGAGNAPIAAVSPQAASRNLRCQ
jgi:hypothetical protein